MKRFLWVPTTALALLVSTPAFAQVETVYVPGAHPRVVVVQPEKEGPTRKVEKAPLTPAEVTAIHTPMAAARRGTARVNYPAVAHCDRLIVEASQALKKNF